MHNIKLRAVSHEDAKFLTFIMNTDTVLNALNELPTQLEDWVDAIQEWSRDSDEEDYIICDGETPVGWLGINSLESADQVAYLKLAAILPNYHNKGIGCFAISQVMDMRGKEITGKLPCIRIRRTTKQEPATASVDLQSQKHLWKKWPTEKPLPAAKWNWCYENPTLPQIRKCQPKGLALLRYVWVRSRAQSRCVICLMGS